MTDNGVSLIEERGKQMKFRLSKDHCAILKDKGTEGNSYTLLVTEDVGQFLVDRVTQRVKHYADNKDSLTFAMPRQIVKVKQGKDGVEKQCNAFTNVRLADHFEKNPSPPPNQEHPDLQLTALIWFKNDQWQYALMDIQAYQSQEANSLLESHNCVFKGLLE